MKCRSILSSSNLEIIIIKDNISSSNNNSIRIRSSRKTNRWMLWKELKSYNNSINSRKLRYKNYQDLSQEVDLLKNSIKYNNPEDLTNQ